MNQQPDQDNIKKSLKTEQAQIQEKIELLALFEQKLQQMKALAILASDDTLAPAKRQLIQQQMTQLQTDLELMVAKPTLPC